MDNSGFKRPRHFQVGYDLPIWTYNVETSLSKNFTT